MYAETYAEWVSGLRENSWLIHGVRPVREAEGAGRFGIEPGLPEAYYLYRKVVIAEPEVAGVEFHARRGDIGRLAPGGLLGLVRERTNRFDRNAVRVCAPGGRTLGYVPRFAARLVAGEMDRGGSVFARVRRAEPRAHRVVVQLYYYRPSCLG